MLTSTHITEADQKRIDAYDLEMQLCDEAASRNEEPDDPPHDEPCQEDYYYEEDFVFTSDGDCPSDDECQIIDELPF